jgi:hypothetical protein
MFFLESLNRLKKGRLGDSFLGDDWDQGFFAR